MPRPFQSRSRATDENADEDRRPQGERLQKVLAAAGIGSRRECEQLIVDGRVDVDRQIVTELGTRVDPYRQLIRVDGEAVPQPRRVYYILNKPVGFVSTNRDPEGRPRVIDMVQTDERLFSVGRLDRTSEGLMLLTNDGDLANRLTHPRYEIEKTYRVHVVGYPTMQQLEQLKRGVHLAEGVARVARLKIRGRDKRTTEIEIVLNEGRNREIRRLLARIGHKVVRLKRVAIGPIHIGDLPVGAHRRLTMEEITLLKQAAEGLGQRQRSSSSGRRSSGRSKRSSAGTAARAGQTRRAKSPVARGGRRERGTRRKGRQ